MVKYQYQMPQPTVQNVPCPVHCRAYDYTGMCSHELDEQGNLHFMGQDGHMYVKLVDGSVGHVDCWCFNKKNNKQK